MQGVLHGTRCALGDSPEPSCHGAVLVQGGDKEFFKFIGFQLLFQSQKTARAAHPRKVLPAFQAKSCSTELRQPQVLPTLELTGGWGTLLTQTSTLPRTEEIPVCSRTPGAPRTHYRQQQVMGLQKKEKGVSPADCSPGCRVPSWPFARLLSWNCKSSL